jgi:hypothetical protein
MSESASLIFFSGCGPAVRRVTESALGSIEAGNPGASVRS